MESAPADLPPGVATSVDVSGKGDPCSFKGKDYSISWYYDKDSTKVTFEYVQPVKQGKWWSAIGIGDNMNDMDIGIIYLNDGNVVDIIDHYSSDYVPPVKDESQDWGIVNSSKSAVDGKAKYVVSRKINTGDDKKDKTMDGCVLFQFGVNLAEYVIKDNNLKIKKHNDWPDLYKACDLKERCLKQNDKVLASTDEKPVSEAKVNIASMGPILPATKCKSSGNTYSSHWYYIKQNDTVEFVLNYQVVPGKSWSTITFGSSPKRDAFMIFVDDKKIIDLGDFVLKNFQETKKDKLQDWNIVYSNVDEKTNFVKVKMSRALVTADKKRVSYL
uniref:DOMON domain-containing protein n=1 Tax=Parastrongyloides trichosuri TaxID=131310 RepID=A0A0N4Z6R4_PARTI